MNKQLIVRVALGVLMAVSCIGLTACQSTPKDAEPMAMTGNIDDDSAQSDKTKSDLGGRRNWGKMRR